MNHVYKTFRNKKTGTFVAASELAAVRGNKSASPTSGSLQRKYPSWLARALAGAGLLGLALTGSAAFAATCSDGDDYGDPWRVACGAGAIADGIFSVSIGANSEASGTHSISVGLQAEASGENSVAMGLNAQAQAFDSIAIGFIANAQADNSIAIGRNTRADDASITVGTRAKASGNGSIAIGADVGVAGAGAVAKGKNSIAMGDNALARADGSIAIGAHSVAGDEETVSFGHSGSDLDQNGNAYGSDLNRRLTHVAKGVSDTDAVNVKQLNDAVFAAGSYTGWDLEADGSNISTVGTGEVVNLKSGSNMDVTKSAGSHVVTFALKDDITVDSVKINSGGSGFDANDTVIKNVSAGAVNSSSKDAVNG